MPRLRLLLLAALLVGMLAVSPAQAATGGFTDDFASLDLSRWVVGSHALGRGVLDPANVSVSGGALSLGLPAGRLDGAELRTAAAYSGGTFSARIRAAAAPSSLTGFFLYAPPDYASEIDIELVGSDVLFTTYADGGQTHTERRPLGFDPTAAFHAYAITFDRKAVTFSVDGAALRTWRNGVPRAPMSLFLNTWFPTWLAGTPSPGAATLVDQVSAAPR
jgi:beta-glucanase (GH16 family)